MDQAEVDTKCLAFECFSHMGSLTHLWSAMNDQTPHHDGPLSGHLVLDLAQGEGGLMSLTGEPGAPAKAGTPVADLPAGIFGVSGVLAALLERQGTARGRVVRTSLLSSMVGIHSFQGTRWTVAGEIPRTTGNQHPAIAPYGLFRCADGDLRLAAGSESLWRAVAEVTGLDPDDPRYAGNAERVRNRTELAAELEAVFSRGSAEQWIGRLDAAGVPWSFNGGGRTRRLPPPTLGQHDRSVRDWQDLEDAARDTGPARAPTATAGAPR